MFTRATVQPAAQAGKERVLAHLRTNVGEGVCSDELAIVAGIKDYPRRIRELRVEDGWPIVSGVQLAAANEDALEDAELGSGLPDLRPDQ